MLAHKFAAAQAWYMSQEILCQPGKEVPAPSELDDVTRLWWEEMNQRRLSGQQCDNPKCQGGLIIGYDSGTYVLACRGCDAGKRLQQMFDEEIYD